MEGKERGRGGLGEGMRGGMGGWCAARVRSCGVGGEEGLEGGRGRIWVPGWVYLDRIRDEGAGYWGESGCRGGIAAK